MRIGSFARAVGKVEKVSVTAGPANRRSPVYLALQPISLGANLRYLTCLSPEALHVSTRRGAGLVRSARYAWMASILAVRILLRRVISFRLCRARRSPRGRERTNRLHLRRNRPAKRPILQPTESQLARLMSVDAHENLESDEITTACAGLAGARHYLW